MRGFNNNCAQSEREARFKQNCPGPFKPALKSYTFGEQSCDTGRHGFNSNDALCRALQNEKLNLNCAMAERESYFKQQCKGDFRKGKSGDHSGAADGDDPVPVISNLDCKGYYISDAGVKTIAWGGRNLTENTFPTVPDHSSIVLTCTQLTTN